MSEPGEISLKEHDFYSNFSEDDDDIGNRIILFHKFPWYLLNFEYKSNIILRF